MADDTTQNKGFRLALPEDSLRDDAARFTAHVVVIGVVLSLFAGLVGALTMMSVVYWG
jgi:hypothetical protein